jgi:hypothetical protein
MPRPDNLDYTAEDRIYHQDQAANAPQGDDIDNFTFAAPDAGFSKSAEEIEKENGFQDIPPGEHELVIVGFRDKPKTVNKQAYVNGRRVSYTVYAVNVKLALPDNPRATVSDYFELPPVTADGAAGYFEGSKDPNKGSKGFMAGKLYHFLERIGFVIVKGRRLPDECLRLGNWKGRRVVATVEAGKPYQQYDQTTGLYTEKAGFPGIKLYSYRPAGSPVAGPAPSSAPSASPAASGPKPSQSGPALRGLNGLDQI